MFIFIKKGYKELKYNEKTKTKKKRKKHRW